MIERNYDNIPKELKGLKWKELLTKKGIIYFLVTLILSLLINNGLVYLLDFNVTTIIYMLCVPLFITAAVVDFKQQLIPDMVDIFLGVLGLINLLFNLNNCVSLALGALFGGLSFLLLGFIAKVVYKKEGMGLGDVKLMAAIGLIVGLKNIVTISLFSFFIAAAYAIVLLIFKSISLIFKLSSINFLQVSIVSYAFNNSYFSSVDNVFILLKKKSLFLSTKNISKKWDQAYRNWGPILSELSIMFDGRI